MAANETAPITPVSGRNEGASQVLSTSLQHPQQQVVGESSLLNILYNIAELLAKLAKDLAKLRLRQIMLIKQVIFLL